MNVITKKAIITLVFLSPTPLFPWTFSGMISDASSSVASYFKKEAHVSSKEYAIGAHVPVTLTNHQGTIKVTTWNKPSLMVEATKYGSEEDLKHSSFAVTVKDDLVTIATAHNTTSTAPAIDYTIIIPRTSPLTIRADSGNISVYESNANVDVQTLDGSIKIEQATKSIRAHAPHGEVIIEQQDLHRDGSIFVEAGRNISLIIPENANATLQAKAPSGKINSDIYITLDPITTKLDKDTHKRLLHSIKGSMGAGGIPVTLETTHGSINILGT